MGGGGDSEGRVVEQGPPLEIARKYGGTWRVRARFSDGGEKVVEVGDLRDLPRVLEGLADAVFINVESPDMFNAFRKLAGYV